MAHRPHQPTKPADFPVVTKASRWELFFAIREILEREGRNVMVHGVAVFELVERRIGGSPPVDACLVDFCRWNGWDVRLVSTDLQRNKPTQVVVRDVVVDETKRKGLNGTLLNSFVLMELQQGFWSEKPHVEEGHDVLDLEPTHRDRRRFEHAVMCCR